MPKEQERGRRGKLQIASFHLSLRPAEKPREEKPGPEEKRRKKGEKKINNQNYHLRRGRNIQQATETLDGAITDATLSNRRKTEHSFEWLLRKFLRSYDTHAMIYRRLLKHRAKDRKKNTDDRERRTRTERTEFGSRSKRTGLRDGKLLFDDAYNDVDVHVDDRISLLQEQKDLTYTLRIHVCMCDCNAMTSLSISTSHPNISSLRSTISRMPTTDRATFQACRDQQSS